MHHHHHHQQHPLASVSLRCYCPILCPKSFGEAVLHILSQYINSLLLLLPALRTLTISSTSPTALLALVRAGWVMSVLSTGETSRKLMDEWAEACHFPNHVLRILKAKGDENRMGLCWYQSARCLPLTDGPNHYP